MSQQNENSFSEKFENHFTYTDLPIKRISLKGQNNKRVIRFDQVQCMNAYELIIYVRQSRKR